MDDIRDLEKYHLKQIRDIIANTYYKLPIKLQLSLSTTEEDTKESFDVVVNSKLKISVRLRKWRYFLGHKDFTIRSKTKHGNKTEIDKLKEGYGQFYLYGWLDDKEEYIKQWVMVDINKFRPYLNNPISKNIPNGDGTCFNAYSLNQIASCGAGIASSNPQ